MICDQPIELWFTEHEGEHLKFGYRVNDRLFAQRSEFQQVDVIETEAYGRMLTLDGFVMITETDEFVYHELISHIPVCLHKNPEKVVVIGGGDGGTIRELARHDCVKEMTLCEIDQVVVDAAREFFPKCARTMDSDPRVTVRIGDGIAFIKELENEVDLIIVDSTDPIGPGEGLFTKEFYRNVAKALRPGGLMVAQSESPWYPASMLRRIQDNIRGGFSHSYPYVGPVPTYPRGYWSWTLASNHELNLANFDRDRFEKVAGELQYLTPGLFAGIFDIPPFFKKKFQ